MHQRESVYQFDGRGRRIEARRFEFVMMATILAGFWSLMSGTVVVVAFRAFSQLFA